MNFNLSSEVCWENIGNEYIYIKDVKEFIRLLKENVGSESSLSKLGRELVIREINKLAGEELI